ncbi:MAG: ketoacyl-ACP synthase III [Syntrophobacteraceae bacterium]
MIGIEAIAGYSPSLIDDNREMIEAFQLEAGFLESKIGVLSKPLKAGDEETSDMCVSAYHRLRDKAPDLDGDLDCIVVCTQHPDGRGLPHTSAIVHGKLGLNDNMAAFDISLGCSGYVYGLSAITAFMKENSLKRGVLFTADPYSKSIDRSDRNTVLLFGDGAAATLLSDTPKLAVERSRFRTRGKDYHALENVNGVLHMNGRAIFNFAAVEVPIQVREILASGNYEIDDMDLFILHQGSKYIVDIIAKRLKLDINKVPCNLRNLGNTVSSSIPMILEDYIDKPEYKNILISGFGVGLSWATAILKRV